MTGSLLGCLLRAAGLFYRAASGHMLTAVCPLLDACVLPQEVDRVQVEQAAATAAVAAAAAEEKAAKRVKMGVRVVVMMIVVAEEMMESSM